MPHHDEITEIITRNSHTVYRLAFAQMKNKNDADDVYQEVFYRFIRSAPVFDSPEHKKAWFIRVTLSSVVKELRDGVDTLKYKRNFLDNLFKQKDCSQYIYDEDFDSSKTDDSEYSIDVSDMAGEDEHYYDFCILVLSKERAVNIVREDSYIEAKTYNKGDKIEGVYYSPDGAGKYLLEHPDTPYSELPTDTIAVHYKTGQTITKQLLTSFNDDGVMQMQYK